VGLSLTDSADEHRFFSDPLSVLFCGIGEKPLYQVDAKKKLLAFSCRLLDLLWTTLWLSFALCCSLWDYLAEAQSRKVDFSQIAQMNTDLF
jgi:hypothetical protein